MFLAVLILNKRANRDYVLLVHKKDMPTLLFLALSGVTIFFTVQYTGIQMASASIASILVCLLSPILITVLSARILKEHLTRKQTVGIGTAAAGTFIVIIGGSLGLNSNPSFLFGSLILLSTPFLWAAYTVVGKTVMKKYSPFLVSAYVNILGGLCLVPFAVAEQSLNTIATMSLQDWSAILYLAFTCSLLGYFIWLHVANQVKAAVTSSFMFAEPLITVLFATAFAGETITLFTIAGGLLIFAGVYLVSRK
jgi:drug/metabolite transporter (DMT)-like permease